MADNGCPGHCCAVFRLQHSQSELIEKAKTGDRDDKYIADMVVPLTDEEVVNRSKAYGFDYKPNTEGHDFTCRHWDEESMLCKEYDDRPVMCADYPYEKDCGRGCSYKPEPDVIERYKSMRRIDE